jgi:general stress protein 26
VRRKIGHALQLRLARTLRMKIEPQATPDLIRLGELIGHMPVAMLTSAGDDGALVSCPMEALEMDGEGALWFFTDLRSDLGERLRVVNLSFVDDSHGTYVSLSGRGEIAKDAQRIERLWSMFDRASFPDGPESRHLALLKVVPDKAEFWDAPNSRTVRLLALAASAVSGTSIGRAEHEVMTGLSSPQPAGATAAR